MTSILGIGRLDWDTVLDLTRDSISGRPSAHRVRRADLRRHSDEDSWLGQPYYPILIVEKDTLEPVAALAQTGIAHLETAPANQLGPFAVNALPHKKKPAATQNQLAGLHQGRRIIAA